MITTLKLGAGVILLIIGNIALGSIDALICRKFEKRTFLNGVIKGEIMIAVFCITYFAGWLNPDLVIVDMGEKTVSIMDAIYLVLLGAYVYYAVETIKKLKIILTRKSSCSQDVSDERKAENAENYLSKGG